MITINPEKQVRDVVVIGTSEGGFAAISKLLSMLPSEMRAFIGVVLHRGAHSRADWSNTLGRQSALPVVEPDHAQPLDNGVVYVAPADKHMTFGRGLIGLDHSAKVHHTRPAIDPLFSSAAHAYGTRVVGVILTGGGRDGTQGFVNIAAGGGLALVQTPEEAQCVGMPEYALMQDHVSAALRLSQLAEVLPKLAQGQAIEVEATRLELA